MTTEQIWELVTCVDPLVPLARHPMESVWTPEAFAEAKVAGKLDDYLSKGEHAESKFEGDVYAIFSDVYRHLEGKHPLKRRLDDEVLGLDEFTLVIFDALSLRELPAVMEVFTEAGVEAEASYSATLIREYARFCAEKEREP